MIVDDKIHNNKNTFKIIAYCLYFSLIILLIFPSLKFYEGSKLIYFIYSIVTNILLLVSLSKNFIISILGVFTWLGFWFKFSFVYAVNFYLNYSFKTPHLSEAVKQYNINVEILILDKVFIDLTLLFLFATIIISLITQKKIDNHLCYKFKFKYKKFILTSSIFILSIFNYYFGIYQ